MKLTLALIGCWLAGLGTGVLVRRAGDDGGRGWRAGYRRGFDNAERAYGAMAEEMRKKASSSVTFFTGPLVPDSCKPGKDKLEEWIGK